ncbi:major facilitator superfamily domain-containing protein [Boletus reticuloceps]|uniref:Major facilitator superfamily domain-containing protein n=1 Tax=Boletus reticuloceps TaxID=495285 RepID=A0A8I2YI39_9AGAM|nr:major facilitator superfamily domain-containing protein [Boletus reticuloceps]
MSEYWVSHKRYHCKYCNIYIADDKPSRQQHENGLRHKGNVERFVRGLYKEGEKRVREREEEKGIMASVGRAAEAAYALDVASGQAGTSSATPQVKESEPKAKMVKPSDPYVNYSTPASLGYRDPDAEEAQERMQAGTPGAWTVVVKSTEAEAETKGDGEEGTAEKRGAAETDEEDVRAFKLRKKTVQVGLGEIYDPAKIEPSEPVQTESVQFRKRKGRPNNTATKSEDRTATDPTNDSLDKPSISSAPATPNVRYRLYKRRFSGLFGFVALGFVTGLPWAWFGPIAPQGRCLAIVVFASQTQLVRVSAAAEFGISVNQVNWLGNVMACLFIPVSLLVPVFCSRFGITRCAQIGSVLTLISGWIRYAGTATSLSSQSAYALLIFGQIFSAIAQPIFQVLGPFYSEKWFDLKGRTTATMAIAIGLYIFLFPSLFFLLFSAANPIGGAIGELLAPFVGTPRQSILVLAIISTATVPAVLFISDSPPTPPTYAGSKPAQSLTSLCRAVLGLSVQEDAYMTFHERLDFVIITILFGVFVGAANAFSVLSAEWLEPVGYSDTTAGLMSASLLLSGIVASGITAPLFDRIFTHRLGLTLRILVPIASVAWFSLIWAVRQNNAAALFAIFVVIGICSLTMLPIGLELGVELTRNADASASLLWCSGNLFAIILILGEGALRASSTANPPYDMKNAIILHGTIIMVFAVLVFFVRARQARRELDEAMAAANAVPMVSSPGTTGKLETTEELESTTKGLESVWTRC